MANKSEHILQLFEQFRKHPKWQSFYLKTIKELINLMDIPPYELIECSSEELVVNEDFCISLFLKRDEHTFPSLDFTFKNNFQNQVVALLNFDNEHQIKNLTIGYLNHNHVSEIEVFKL